MRMSRITLSATTLIAFSLLTLPGSAAAEGRKYAPFSEYEMPREAEIALARSAAPAKISSRATIKVLTRNGFELAVQGDNGFLCMVLRSWSAAPDPEGTYYAKTRSPICFDAIAARIVAPVDELRTQLGLKGTPPEAIEKEVVARYGSGKLKKLESIAFGYMWSADQDTGPGAGAWHPHMMVYAPPNYENSTLGGNEVGGHTAPFVAGSGPLFSLVIIPVDDKLAIKAKD
jgi:hypothetical protein